MEIQHTVLDNESTHCQRRRDKSSLVGHRAKQDAVSDLMSSLFFPLKKIAKLKKIEIPPQKCAILHNCLIPNTLYHNSPFVNAREQ